MILRERMNCMDEDEKCEFYNPDDGTCKGTPYGPCLHMDFDMNNKCRADEGWERKDEEDDCE